MAEFKVGMINKKEIDDLFKSEINKRLTSLYDGFAQLEKDGLGVHAIVPQAAMYLTVQFNILGKIAPNGEKINSIKDISKSS